MEGPSENMTKMSYLCRDMPKRMIPIELLAPAKSYDGARAAIDHGADAIYIGGTRFGARSAACNSIDDIARSVEYAHQYGARLYATMNTLIFEEELRDAERAARELVSVGVDALIVQDLAFARMGLGVELHSSTQMCNDTVKGVRFLSEVGFSRIVLERNLSFAQIAQIREGCDAELEAFIHGAICVGYSGRCFLSRAMTPSRSGNRGECSQPCRLSYDLVTEDGERLIEGQHLLTVKDLNLSSRIGDLLDQGVSSLKIEGRLKELSYTKNIVAHYRKVVDREMEMRGNMVRSSEGRSRIEFEPNPSKSFSRGETAYCADGGVRGVASLRTPKALGEPIGEVAWVRGEQIGVKSLSKGAEISTGDGICYLGERGLEGSNVNRVDALRGVISLNRVGKISVGSQLYRNFDRLFEAAVESSRSKRVIAIRGEIFSSLERVELSYTDGSGNRASAVVAGPFEPTKNRDKMEQTIVTQLSKCGDTIFEAERIETKSWGGEFIASSQLSALRREALDRLREMRIERAAQNRGVIFAEKSGVRYPVATIGGEVGVTNSLAEKFYRDHGVELIEPSFERAESLDGVAVMRSAYCIRREIGECLRRGSDLRGDLFLVRGESRFRLDFDCIRCRMSLIKVKL